jgi:hypothetical protein
MLLHKMKTGLNIKLAIVAGLVAACASLPAYSGSYKHFPGADADRETIHAQELVEQLYDSRQYERALKIYEQELSPIGDKYAQYMVGYMYLAGQGVEANRAIALAWYRMAAERNESAIVQARDELFASLTADEIAKSNEVFVRLWRAFGDNRLVLNLVHEDLKILTARTGSRIPGSYTSPITVVPLRTGQIGSEAYYERVEQRLKERLDYLETNVEIIDIEQNEESGVTKSLESEIRKEMAAFDTR